MAVIGITKGDLKVYTLRMIYRERSCDHLNTDSVWPMPLAYFSYPFVRGTPVTHPSHQRVP